MKRFVIALALVATFSLVATWIHLELPLPSGSYSVGRLETIWTDDDRPEVHTTNPMDRRHVGVVVWYPSVRGSGTTASYLPNEKELIPALAASGEVNPASAWGLRWVRGHSEQGAEIDPSQAAYPVVLLSPGNATNVEFYASMAEDLASNGYIVVGINHPYQVPATPLGDGSFAMYQEDLDVTAKIEERVFDLRFVINRLERETKSQTLLRGRLALDSLAVMGHSNGGLAAVELCRADKRLKACLNIDGQAAGGALGTHPDDEAPSQSFLFLTKERSLHEEIAGRFEAGRHGGYRVVIPAATHSAFSDGALFTPTIWPFARTVDRVNEVSRGFANAFLDLTLKGAPQSVLGEVSAPTDVLVYVYPLARA